MLASKLRQPRLRHFQRNRAAVVCRAALAGPTTRVSFKIHYRCNLGEHVCLTGAGAKLGNWDVAKAVQMAWTEEDAWVVDLEADSAPSVEMEYKYFVRGPTGEALSWMDGENLSVAVPVMHEDGKRAECISIQDTWDQAFQSVSLSLMQDKPAFITPQPLKAQSAVIHQQAAVPSADSWMSELLTTAPATKVAQRSVPATGERGPAGNAELTNRMDAIETEVFGLKENVKAEMETLREEVKTVTKESVLFVLKRISEVDNSVNELRSQTADAFASIHDSIRELNRVSERLTKFETGVTATQAQQQRFERETAVRELARASPRNNGWRR